MRLAAAVAGDDPRLSLRPPAAEQGPELPGRPADGRGDHRGDAPRRRSGTRNAHPGADRALWRAGLRINEALSLTETDLDPERGSILIRQARAADVARSGWTPGGGSSLPWLERAALPVGPLFCVIAGPTAGRAWSATAARASCTRSRSPRASGVASRRSSSGMRTRSRRTERNPELPQRSRAGSDCAGCAVVRSNEAAAAFGAGDD